VQAPARIDVKVAAQLAGMSEEEFKALNPAHNKPVAVASTGTLVVPLDKADLFRENLESYDQPLVSWTTYTAKKGESIDAIAKKHGLTSAQLKLANDSVKLDKKGRLRVGGPVLVPARAAAGAPRPAETPVVAKAPPAAPPKAAAPAEPAPSSYVVRAGDTLYSIARRFDTAVDTLLSLNKLSPTAVIQPGLRLRLN
jgi:membrane-bound lytic murein transglycosylase D